MPELAVKIKTAPNNRSTTINGTSHHFFSCFEKRQNSFRSDHMSCLECKTYVMADKEKHARVLANRPAVAEAINDPSERLRDKRRKR
jgi:hypothetical protein